MSARVQIEDAGPAWQTWPDLTDQLVSFMQDLSEKHYCAGWMKDLEYELWAIATNQPAFSRYGSGSLSQGEKDLLMYLNGKIGGWVLYDDDGVWARGSVRHLRFVPNAEWIKLFKERTHG